MTVVFPEIMLGGAGYAGLYHPVDADSASRTLHTAWQEGIRGFDTAPHYGAGLSEERLGEFLAERPREEYLVSTKVGRLLYADPDAVDGTDGFFGAPARSRRRDYSGAGVRRSLEDSLTRLRLDRVDVASIHDPDDHVPEALAGAAPQLVRMRDEGMVDAIGVGVNDADLALRFVREVDLDFVLIAGRYSLLDRRATALLDECARFGVLVLVAGVFNSGLLADPWQRTTFDYHRADPELVCRAQAMDRVCTRHGTTLRTAALQFPMRHPAVRSVVIGADSSEQVRDGVERLQARVPSDVWAELDDLAWWP